MESVQAQLGTDEVSPADQFAALQLAVAVEVERTSRLIDCSKFVVAVGKSRPRPDGVHCLERRHAARPVQHRPPRLQHIHTRHQRGQL